MVIYGDQWLIFWLVVEPYPSEKCELVGMMKFPTEWKNRNVPNHQPAITMLISWRAIDEMMNKSMLHHEQCGTPIPVYVMRAVYVMRYVILLVLSREWGNDPQSLVIIPFPYSHPFPTEHQHVIFWQVNCQDILHGYNGCIQFPI